MQQWLCGTVDKAVAYDTRGPQFKSTHQQKFIYIEHLFAVNCVLKRWKLRKRGREWPIFENSKLSSAETLLGPNNKKTISPRKVSHLKLRNKICIILLFEWQQQQQLSTSSSPAIKCHCTIVTIAPSLKRFWKKNFWKKFFLTSGDFRQGNWDHSCKTNTPISRRTCRKLSEIESDRQCLKVALALRVSPTLHPIKKNPA